jgi:2-aminomuconate deaminase
MFGVAIEQVTLTAMGTSDTINTKEAPPPVGAYPHAKRLGNLLFLSGIGPRSATGGPIPGVILGDDGEIKSYDIEAQCHAVFANVRAVLESAGARWDDLVDVTVYLTDIKNDFAAYNRVYAEYFSSDGPTRTTVEVNRLPTPIAIELKCIAEAKPK